MSLMTLTNVICLTVFIHNVTYKKINVVGYDINNSFYFILFYFFKVCHSQFSEPDE